MTLKVINILKFHLPVKGLLVLLGATCLLVSQSSDYSYGKLHCLKIVKMHFLFQHLTF